MVTTVILFFSTLLLLVLFIFIKTGELRSGQIPQHITHELGDKDSWIKFHIRALQRFITHSLRRMLYEFLVWFFRGWMDFNRKLFLAFRRRYPELAYLVGDRPEIKNTKQVASSKYMRSIKDHVEKVKGTDSVEENVETKEN